MRIMRVNRRRISNRAISTERFWQVVILTAAGTIGAISHADAALYYWQDSDPNLSRSAPTVQPPRQRTHRRSKGKTEAAAKETSAKPQGPLIIAVSIDKQKVRIFDDNGVFAEAPVSTGMPGHSTPTGVFSVIQKHKFHHSNIYSGAPMPFMQRITWSGVAMHAGVLPGYPASHGCIRMPMAFAVKMWNWTKMGVRVVITPGEITPASFSHPLLATKRVLPKPVAANEPQTDVPPATQADKAAEADAAPKPVIAEASLELRSTVGHDNGVKPVIAEQPGATTLGAQTRTTYARGDMPAAKASVTMSDAAPGAKSESAPSEPAKSEPDAAAAKRSEMTSADDKPADAPKHEAPANGKAEGKPEESITAGTGISPS